MESNIFEHRKECLYKPLHSSNCVNYYDSQLCMSGDVKKEFPDNECLQSSISASCINKCSIDSKIILEDEALSEVLETQALKQENLEETIVIEREEIPDEKNQFIAKTEVTEEHRILDNTRDTSYEVMITPQEIQPEMCGGILKYRFNFLTHNKDYIKVEPCISEDNERSELHKCQCCDEYFNNHDNMLAHMVDIHSNKKPKSDLYHEGIKPYPTERNGKEITHKCDLCERVYKSKDVLLIHIKKFHYNDRRIFKCWCGKQFRTPIKLYHHKYKRHGVRMKAKESDKFQCDICKKFFRSKSGLVIHITSNHYDYVKTFECWCGKQFHSSTRLDAHKYLQHGVEVKTTNNAALKSEFQCDICQKILKRKKYLISHIKDIHYDYGKTFGCWCGKQFRTPKYLYTHKYRQHDANVKSTNNTAFKTEFQCDICKKILKSKRGLIIHITINHNNYDKTFECWCGKQFRTPIHLHSHKYRQHDDNGKSTSNAAFKTQFQCDICKKIFKKKVCLKVHIKSSHYDYGKIFGCWCGKQFRASVYLREHQRYLHNIENKNEYKCEYCESVFKVKRYLAYHVKRMHN